MAAAFGRAAAPGEWPAQSVESIPQPVCGCVCSSVHGWHGRCSVRLAYLKRNQLPIPPAAAARAPSRAPARPSTSAWTAMTTTTALATPPPRTTCASASRLATARRPQPMRLARCPAPRLSCAARAPTLPGTLLAPSARHSTPPRPATPAPATCTRPAQVCPALLRCACACALSAVLWAAWWRVALHGNLWGVPLST